MPNGIIPSFKPIREETLFFIFSVMQLIQIYSVDWRDVCDKHNIEHRTEPVSH